MKIDEKLAQLKITLPPPPSLKALYKPVKQTGQYLYVSGQIPIVDGELSYTGTVGKELGLEQAQDAARICIYNMLSVVKAHVADLDRIKGVVKVFGLVQSEKGFNEQHLVINAASQILIDIFGDEGWHARSAVGTNQLPLGAPVEIEAIFECK